MKNLLKSKIFYFILGTAIFGSIGVVFAFSYFAYDVGYTPRVDDWEVDNVRDALDDLHDLIDRYKNESDIITSVTFNSVPTNDSFSLTPVLETTDSSKVFGYHAFAIDDDQNIYLNMSTSNNVTISGLTTNTYYNVYVMAYDVFNRQARSTTLRLKTTSTLDKKSYSASNGSYPYVLTSGQEKTLISYGECNLKLKKMYVKLQAGNSGAISASTITAYVYGYTNGSWELIKSFSAGRGVRVSSATIVNTTVDLSSNEKVYTNFYVSARSNDHEIYAAAEFQPTGVIID